MKEIRKLKKLEARREALVWLATQPDWATAWQVCDRGDWMLWLMGRLSGAPESDARKKLVLVVCQCARLSLPYVPAGELRPLQSIEMAEKWANGDGSITLEQLAAARDAAWAAWVAAWAAWAAGDAAWAAGVAAWAAWDAAWAAGAAAWAAGAAGATAWAAWDAAWAAGAAAWAAGEAAGEAAGDAARDAALTKCADIVRAYYPTFQINDEEAKDNEGNQRT